MTVKAKLYKTIGIKCEKKHARRRYTTLVTTTLDDVTADRMRDVLRRLRISCSGLMRNALLEYLDTVEQACAVQFAEGAEVDLHAPVEVCCPFCFHQHGVSPCTVDGCGCHVRTID